MGGSGVAAGVVGVLRGGEGDFFFLVFETLNECF